MWVWSRFWWPSRHVAHTWDEGVLLTRAQPCRCVLTCTCYECVAALWSDLCGVTGGIPGVDDAECPGGAELLGAQIRSLQLLYVQGPAAVLVQVVVDVHGVQLWEGSGVQRVLRDGDQHPRPAAALPRHQQLQDALQHTHSWCHRQAHTLLLTQPHVC